MHDTDLTYVTEEHGFSLSLRQSGIAPKDITALKTKAAAAHKEMKKIEKGQIKNPDEGRAVTHFSDRKGYVEGDLYKDVEDFFCKVREGEIVGSTGWPFDSIIINGIGGSALGPQFVQFALNGPYWNELPDSRRNNNLRIYFTDNTDSAGLNDILSVVDLETTLAVHISKSGGTRETKNNQTAIESAFTLVGLNAAKHCAAVTMDGSKLFNYATKHGWLKIWEMAESIGGRTSETAIVGHVPAAAAGIDFAGLINGANLMDKLTEKADILENPAYLLAAAWYVLGDGKGEKNMVIVPYADRLVLLSRYLQQLVMESLGKELDLDGNTVYQGLNVFGNKGGTDAHAFIQQLNDGRNDFFITFIEVLKDNAFYHTGNGMSMGDYLHNFKQGLANALAGKQRSVLEITIEELNAETLGMLIALYERAVAFYAELININAFHQPGVEAYKKISKEIDAVMMKVMAAIANNKGFSGDAEAVAQLAQCAEAVPEVEGILSKFAVNQRDFDAVGVVRTLKKGRWQFEFK